MQIDLSLDEIIEIIKCMELTECEYSSCDWNLIDKLKNYAQKQLQDLEKSLSAYSLDYYKKRLDIK